MVVQMALVHAQFEILRPFVYGNGRLGRILIPLFSCERHLLNRRMFYLSGYLEARRDQYVRKLRTLNGPDSWNQWIGFFLDAVTEQNIIVQQPGIS